MLKNEFLTIYQEIKHPYTKLNLSYHLFKIAACMAAALFLISLIDGVILTFLQLQGNMTRFEQVAVNAAYSTSFFAAVCLPLFLISSLLRKKI